MSRSNTISNSKNGNSAYKDLLVGKDFISYLRDRLVDIIIHTCNAQQNLCRQIYINIRLDYKIRSLVMKKYFISME